MGLKWPEECMIPLHRGDGVLVPKYPTTEAAKKAMVAYKTHCRKRRARMPNERKLNFFLMQ